MEGGEIGDEKDYDFKSQVVYPTREHFHERYNNDGIVHPASGGTSQW
jgi:hypothetical protein